MGKVNITRIGLISILTKPITKAAINEVKKLAT
jgi:hypothetical protein